MQLGDGLSAGRELRVFEAPNERQVIAQDIGEHGHEQVVKGLEAAAEGDRFGERHARLDLEVLGREFPRRVPVSPEPISLGDRQPASFSLALGGWRGKLASVEMRNPVGRYPAECRVVDVVFHKPAHGKRRRPAFAMRHVSQQPASFLMIGLAVENRTQAHARQGILRRSRLRRPVLARS